MRVVVNGEDRQFPEGTTIASLLGALGLGEVRVAVEVNRTVVPRSRHAETAVAEGDRVEVVRFVGGG
jgi:sulfur carrier protein